MKRKHITLLAIITAFFAAVIPIGLAIIISYKNTVREAQLNLYHHVKMMAHHTDQLITSIDHGLDNTKKIDLSCDLKTTQALRTLVFDVPEIREAAVISPIGEVTCTSWGKISLSLSNLKPLSTNSIQINGPQELPLVKRPVLVLSKRRPDHSYIAALILPQLLTGIIGSNFGMDGFSGLIREKDHQLLAYVGNRSPIISFQKKTRQDNTVMLVAEFADHIKRTVIAQKLEHFSDVYAFTAVTDHWILKDWKQTAWTLVLIGIIVASCLITLIVLLVRERLSLRGELQHAIRHRKFSVNYLPIIDLKTKRCVGAEALIRWNHPDQGLLPPDFFIPLAERTRLIEPMTEWLMEQVCDELEGLLIQERDFHIGINLSPCHFENDRILKTSARIFGKTDINPNQITYEITERSLIPSSNTQPLAIIKNLRDRGSSIALDDFGTGYSSLSYLSNFPIHTLKIDRHFVAAIGTDAVTSSLIIAIIDMASRLNAEVIAEGVENADQADYLYQHGVKLAQGWHYSKPVDAASLIAFTQKQAQV